MINSVLKPRRNDHVPLKYYKSIFGRQEVMEHCLLNQGSVKLKSHHFKHFTYTAFKHAENHKLSTQTWVKHSHRWGGEKTAYRLDMLLNWHRQSFKTSRLFLQEEHCLLHCHVRTSAGHQFSSKSQETRRKVFGVITTLPHFPPDRYHYQTPPPEDMTWCFKVSSRTHDFCQRTRSRAGK